MNKICVFCGSSPGNDKIYTEAAIKLADIFIKYNITLIYGGGKIGLMGVLANRMLEQQGEVIGIIPKFLFDKEVAHTGITKLIQVNSMHERKALIQKESDGFIALPGGFGTFEEIFEMITWGQLNIHQKPCAFLNINSYYNHIFGLLDNAVNHGFIAQEFKELVIIEDHPENIVPRFLNYQHPIVDKASLALNRKI